MRSPHRTTAKLVADRCFISKDLQEHVSYPCHIYVILCIRSRRIRCSRIFNVEPVSLPRGNTSQSVSAEAAGLQALVSRPNSCPSDAIRSPASLVRSLRLNLSSSTILSERTPLLRWDQSRIPQSRTKNRSSAIELSMSRANPKSRDAAEPHGFQIP